MKECGKITRRSTLQLTTLGVSSSLLASALPHKLYAQAPGDVNKAIAWAKANLPNSIAEIIQGAARERKLTLLLLQVATDDQVVALIKKFNEHYPFIDVSYSISSGLQATNRFTAELNAKKGISDYINTASDISQLDRYIARGALTEFIISQDAAFPDSAKRGGLWYGWLRQQAVTAYRVGALSEEEKKLVRTYKGLSDPRFKGRLGVTSITSATSQTAAYVLLNQPDKKIWENLVANKPRVKAAASSVIDGLLAGEYDVGVFTGFGTAVSAAMDKAPVEFGISSPSPLQYIPGGVSALAPNPNSAKLWQDFVMSKETQKWLSSTVGSLSPRSDVTDAWAQQQPWFFEDPSKQVALDWTDFAAKQADVIERFKKDIQEG